MEGKEKHSLLFLPCSSCAITPSPSGISTTYAPSQKSMLYVKNISLLIYLHLLLFKEKPGWETSRATQNSQEDTVVFFKQLYK